MVDGDALASMRWYSKPDNRTDEAAGLFSWRHRRRSRIGAVPA
jgi:hypothetical protein